jgi:hypothetical protein
MNALEAGSGRVFVELECEGIDYNKPGAKLTITDDGQGFRNKTEIVDWFETFGTPHEESEHKTFLPRYGKLMLNCL